LTIGFNVSLVRDLIPTADVAGESLPEVLGCCVGARPKVRNALENGVVPDEAICLNELLGRLDRLEAQVLFLESLNQLGDCVIGDQDWKSVTKSSGALDWQELGKLLTK
jgi:hypothetical protein